MVTFLRRLRADVPVIVRAYLLGQTDVLAEHCAPQMVEQLLAIIRAQHSQVLPRCNRNAWLAMRPTLCDCWGQCQLRLRLSMSG